MKGDSIKVIIMLKLEIILVERKKNVNKTFLFFFWDLNQQVFTTVYLEFQKYL